MIELTQISYKGWENCLCLANAHVELILTLDVGPRVISFRTRDGQNVFKNYDEMMGVCEEDEWMIFGGHRLWHAPEHEVRTYIPDFDPVSYTWEDSVLTLSPPEEEGTGLRKEMLLELAEDSPTCKVTHRIHNHNLFDVELAPWCLSVMDVGARAIAPQEPFGPHPDYLLPARPLVLWSFTNMADRRWTWGEQYLQLQQECEQAPPQKVGFFNSLGWVACAVHDSLFLVDIEVQEGAHADMGSNMELFTNEDMLEVETLGPLAPIAPGDCAEHVEHWGLFDVKPGSSDAEIRATVLPCVKELRDA